MYIKQIVLQTSACAQADQDHRCSHMHQEAYLHLFIYFNTDMKNDLSLIIKCTFSHNLNVYTFRGSNSVKRESVSLVKGIYSRRKEVAPS